MSILNSSGQGPELKFQIGTPPVAAAAGVVNGTGIDRLGANFCVLESVTGAVTGAPTTQTQDVKLQHSDALGSGYVDFLPGGVAAAGAVAQITAANSRKRKQIDLRGAKRYIRAVTTTAFTGGTTPTLASYVAVVLGGYDVLPPQVDD
jgi:hypothetical protein